jgi:hypothetical protein
MFGHSYYTMTNKVGKNTICVQTNFKVCMLKAKKKVVFNWADKGYAVA